MIALLLEQNLKRFGYFFFTYFLDEIPFHVPVAFTN